MRDKNLNPEQLNIQLTRICRRKLQRLVLTEAVFVNPKRQFEVYLGPIPRKLQEVKALIILSYFCSDEALGYFLREEIRERRLTQFSLEDRLEIEILLNGRKEVVLNFLTLREDMSSRTFFGNIVPLGINVFNNLSLYRRKLRQPVEPIRRRGYKDKGSRRPETKWLPSSDYSWTEEQLERERIQDQYQDYLKKLEEILRE